jgi:hypothetical protein
MLTPGRKAQAFELLERAAASFDPRFTIIDATHLILDNFAEIRSAKLALNLAMELWSWPGSSESDLEARRRQN